MEKKERLDKEIARRFSISRNHVRDLLDDKLVFVNNKNIKKGSYLVSSEDIITLKEKKSVKALPKFASVYENIIEEKNGVYLCDVQPNRNEVVVIFENSDFIVILKGEDVLSHSSNTKKGSVDVSTSLIENGYKLGGSSSDRVGIVHRLDEDTKGLMVITKTEKAFDEFKKMFKNKKIIRKYLGVCEGELEHKNTIIKGKILNDFRNYKMVVNSDGKEAITHVKAIYFHPEENLSLNEFKLETGRTHQIRVHMAKIGNPMLGDKKYGKRPENTMMLFSYFLKFSFNNEAFQFVFKPKLTFKSKTTTSTIKESITNFLSY